MFRRSVKDINLLTKCEYVLYQNNKFAIIKHYNWSGKKNYFRDIKECFSMLVAGLIGIIGFPFVLLYTLISFIPKVYIIDESIDIKKQEERDKANKEMEDLLKTTK